MRVGYHNHWWEVERDFDGRHGLEVLADHLAPEVVLEVDTYWATVGGADVPALLGRLGDRVVALHIKDGDGTPRHQEAGRRWGRAPFRSGTYIAAAAGCTVGWSSWTTARVDMLEAVGQSYAYITSSGSTCSHSQEA